MKPRLMAAPDGGLAAVVVVVQEVKVLEEAVNRQANAVLQKTRMLDDLNHTVAEVRTQQENAPVAGDSHALYAQSKPFFKWTPSPHLEAAVQKASHCTTITLVLSGGGEDPGGDCGRLWRGRTGHDEESSGQTDRRSAGDDGERRSASQSVSQSASRPVRCPP